MKAAEEERGGEQGLRSPFLGLREPESGEFSAHSELTHPWHLHRHLSSMKPPTHSLIQSGVFFHGGPPPQGLSVGSMAPRQALCPRERLE